MIISIGAYFIGTFVNMISAVLPAWNFPTGFLDNMSGLYDTIKLFDTIVPIHTVFALVLLAFAFEITLIGYRVVMSLITILRGGGEIPM